MQSSSLHKSSHEPEHEERAPVKLDLITFEVLKNAFINLVDQMSEQLLRTCYSFVIYSRDFSNCICDRHGNTVAQGTQDIAVHVGTLHFSVKSVIEQFGADIRPGDVFITNDPYNGGTHFNDVRIIRPFSVTTNWWHSPSRTGTGQISAAVSPVPSTSPPRNISARGCASRR